MARRRQHGTVSADEWAGCTDPHRLVRWSGPVTTPRAHLLVACAVVRSGFGGPSTDLGREVLDALGWLARLPAPAGRLVDAYLGPRFPDWFRPTPPHLTDRGRRELGADEWWLCHFLRSAAEPARAGPPLVHALIDAAGRVAGAAARPAAGAVVAAVGRERREKGPPDLLRRLLGLGGVRVPLSRREQCRKVLEHIPAGVRPGWAVGTDDLCQATRALESHYRRERVAELQAKQAGVVRCVFGDPFWRWDPHPDWTAPGTAARRLAGHVDATGEYALLPVLADALEDAGCTDPAPLDHCRAPGPHVAGCWVVEAVLRR